MEPFLLKSKQESLNRIFNRNLSDPKDLLKPRLVGDDLVLYVRQNTYVNVLLQKLITSQAGISILDKAKGDASNTFDNLNIYHELSDISSARSVILLDNLDQL